MLTRRRRARRAAAPSSMAPATTSKAAAHARPYSGRHASPASSAIEPIRTCPTSAIVAGLGAVGDVAGAELAQLRQDRVEVAQRLAQEDERAEQHGLLPAQVGAGEERLDGRGSREQPRVERVHQLVAAGGDEVEARLEGVEIEGHAPELGRAGRDATGGARPPTPGRAADDRVAGIRQRLSVPAARARRGRGGCRPRSRRGPSVWKIAWTSRSIARGLRKSCLAIARFERPSAISDEHRALAVVELVEHRAPAPRDEAADDSGVEGRASCGDAFDRVEELGDVAHAVLEQVADAGRVVPDELEHVRRLQVLGEHEHRHGRVRAADLCGREQPVVSPAGWHAHVDDGDVRLVRADLEQQGLGVRCPADDLVARILEQRGDAFAQERVVIGDDHAKRP